MNIESALEIVAYGAWNGGRSVGNDFYENKGMTFKGDIPVTAKTIEQRIGIRTRMAAGADERIGVSALDDLIENSGIDPRKIKVVIGATNVGEDLYDAGPVVRHPFERIRRFCPEAVVFDLYAGCPGFNVAVELLLMLSLTGQLDAGDLSVIIGAENLHRAKPFRPNDTANIIFGDDSLATALRTDVSFHPHGDYRTMGPNRFGAGKHPAETIAWGIHHLVGSEPLDGIILDNQTGTAVHRVPPLAARVQQRLVELRHPEAAAAGTFSRFKEALAFYDANVRMTAFDIMTLDRKPDHVLKIARAYVESGRFGSVVSVFVGPDYNVEVTLHTGRDFSSVVPRRGIVDALTRSHGCFGHFIQAVLDGDAIFGEMDGKGVFLYATRGAKNHLSQLLSRNGLSMADVGLLFEHQANFAMIPMTIEQVLDRGQENLKKEAAEFVAAKMPTNIHERGNCSVVCMQRLPYDLRRNALKPDVINGYRINENLKALEKAKIVLNDSVGAGMIRSSFLQILE